MGFTGRNIKIFPSVLLLLAVILSSLNVIASDISGAGVEGMTVILHEDGDKIDITWENGLKGTASLIMILPSGKINTLYNQIDLSAGKLTFDMQSTEYLYSGFTLSNEDGQYLYPFTYITNQGVLGETYSYPEITSKKGLDIRLISDAQQLGVSHTVLDVELNHLISDKTETAQNITVDGKEYFFDSVYISSLDHKIKVLTDIGINIYLQVVLTEKQENISKAASSLYYATPSDEADYYAVSMLNNSAEYLFSALRFLSLRYTSSDGKYGFAGSYIIGNCINSNRYGNYAGAMPQAEYVELYVSVFRTAYAAIKSVYANARIYVPINDNFNVPSDVDKSPDANLDYTAKDFLVSFNTTVKQGGNIDWALCTEVYCVDISSPCFWTEKTAVNEQSTPYITMKNIGVLTDMLSQEEFLYNSKNRSVTISKCAFSAKDNSTKAQSEQAAAYALAYYTAEANGMINAFIYDSHVDLVGDACKNAGLFTRRENTLQLTDEKKEIYGVFKAIDTADSFEVTEKYLKIIGASSFDKIIQNHTATQEKRAIFTGIAGKNVKHPTIQKFDFRYGVWGFYPSDNSKTVATEVIDKKGYLICETLNSDIIEYRGVCRTLSDVDISDAGYITFDINVQTPQNVKYVDVMVRLWGKDILGKTIVYEGMSQINSFDTVQLSYNISEFVSSCGDNVQGVKIWVKPYSNKDGGDYTLRLSDVTFLDKSPSYTAFFVVLSVMVILLIIFVVVFKIKMKRQNLNTQGENTQSSI